MDRPRTLAGKTLMVGLPGPELDSATAERLTDLRPGGVILFARNVESAGQTAALLDAVGASLPHPLLLALDQEGGRVSRLESLVGSTPTALRLSAAGATATHRFGRSTGRALRALGFNLDFAPVVDLCNADATNGIGDRSFGSDPDLASSLAAEFLTGLQGAGVAGCIKHFPGLGRTRVDSHLELPQSNRTIEDLEAEELVPFRRLARSAASVMIAHVHFPAIDPVEGRPGDAIASRRDRHAPRLARIPRSGRQ